MQWYWHPFRNYEKNPWRGVKQPRRSQPPSSSTSTHSARKLNNKEKGSSAIAYMCIHRQVRLHPDFLFRSSAFSWSPFHWRLRSRICVGIQGDFREGLKQSYYHEWSLIICELAAYERPLREILNMRVPVDQGRSSDPRWTEGIWTGWE